jgi:hypothetical protein
VVGSGAGEAVGIFGTKAQQGAENEDLSKVTSVGNISRDLMGACWSRGKDLVDQTVDKACEVGGTTTNKS